jgi:ATP-dependent Clp protease protease subunit
LRFTLKFAFFREIVRTCLNIDEFVCKAAFEKEDENGEGKQSSCDSMIQKRFLKERRIFLWGEVNHESAKDITEKLLYLEIVEPNSPIDFFINTPGGSITAGMAVYDTMKLIKPQIRVVVTGLAASMGQFCFAEPKKAIGLCIRTRAFSLTGL